MGWGRVWCMPERGKIQDVYLHPNRNAKDISREFNMDKGLLFRILKKLEANHSRHPQEYGQSTSVLWESRIQENRERRTPHRIRLSVWWQWLLLPDLERIPINLRLLEIQSDKLRFMEIHKVHSVFFSATFTTKAIVQGIVKQLHADNIQPDITSNVLIPRFEIGTQWIVGRRRAVLFRKSTRHVPLRRRTP